MWAELGLDRQSTGRDKWVSEGIVGKRLKPTTTETLESTSVTLARISSHRIQNLTELAIFCNQVRPRVEGLGYQPSHKATVCPACTVY